MTTQAISLCLMGPQGGRRFYKADMTDATFGEIQSATGTVSLHNCMKGMLITQYIGEYAASEGVWRIKNKANQNVCGGVLDPLGEARIRKLDAPYTVQDGDVLEIFCDVA